MRSHIIFALALGAAAGALIGCEHEMDARPPQSVPVVELTPPPAARDNVRANPGPKAGAGTSDRFLWQSEPPEASAR